MMLHVICVAYGRTEELGVLIGSFLVQTSPNWILHVVYDGPAPQEILNIVSRYNDPRVHFHQSPERYQNYGHPNRKIMLQTIEADNRDFILMTNDDNYYVPVFVKKMLGVVKSNTGIVLCNTVHSHAEYDVHDSHLYECGIDMGAFIVRADVAKKTGFNHVHFSADGTYATECLATCIKNHLKALKIHKPYFVHN